MVDLPLPPFCPPTTVIVAVIYVRITLNDVTSYHRAKPCGA
jgi:hypothetical protein